MGIKIGLIPCVCTPVDFVRVHCISCAGERPLKGCKNQLAFKMASCCGVWVRTHTHTHKAMLSKSQHALGNSVLSANEADV